MRVPGPPQAKPVLRSAPRTFSVTNDAAKNRLKPAGALIGPNTSLAGSDKSQGLLLTSSLGEGWSSSRRGCGSSVSSSIEEVRVIQQGQVFKLKARCCGSPMSLVRSSSPTVRRRNGGQLSRAGRTPPHQAPATRALAGIGVTRLSQLTEHRAADLRELHGMGPRAIAILRQALNDRKLSLQGDA